MKEKCSKPTRFRWVVLVLIFLAYMIAGADRANIGMVVPFVKDEFKLSNTDIGAMSSLFYIGYAAIQVPIGLVYSKYGVRIIFVVAMILTSISTFVMGFVNSGFQLKAARVALGIAEGPINIGIVSTINRWYPQKEKGFATGVFMSSIKFAPAVVPPLCAIIIQAWGWREIFYIFAIPGFLIAALWFFFVKDNPKESKHCSEAELNYILTESAQGGIDAVKTPAEIKSDDRFRLLDKIIRKKDVEPLDTHRKVLTSWNIWACAFGYFFMVGIAYAIMTWVPTYLIKVKHFSTLKTGLVAATQGDGSIVGQVESDPAAPPGAGGGRGSGPSRGGARVATDRGDQRRTPQALERVDAAGTSAAPVSVGGSAVALPGQLGSRLAGGAGLWQRRALPGGAR